MREDDDFRHYVPLLRRIIILVAVIIAVPVILWTITVFVRTYVGPPRMPTFHQLASTASINAPSARSGSEAAAQSSQGADGQFARHIPRELHTTASTGSSGSGWRWMVRLARRRSVAS